MSSFASILLMTFFIFSTNTVAQMITIPNNAKGKLDLNSPKDIITAQKKQITTLERSAKEQQIQTDQLQEQNSTLKEAVSIFLRKKRWHKLSKQEKELVENSIAEEAIEEIVVADKIIAKKEFTASQDLSCERVNGNHITCSDGVYKKSQTFFDSIRSILFKSSERKSKNQQNGAEAISQ